MNDRADTDAVFRQMLKGYCDMTADLKALDARLDERRKLNTIITAYMLALADPNTKIPTYLHAAIELARSA